MPAGKSSERLAEEIAAYSRDELPYYGMTPIEVYKAMSGGAVQPDFTGYTMPGLPRWPNVYNGLFISTRTHVQLECDRDIRLEGNGDVERDWHLLDHSPEGNIAVLACSLTGAQLTINIYSSEIPNSVRASFSSAAVQARSAKLNAEARRRGEGAIDGVVPAHEQANPGAQNPASATAGWELFARIVYDLIVVPADERRSISGDNPKPARLLDMELVLPFVGFLYDSESRMYNPPQDDSPEYLRWLRRVLLEVLFEVRGVQYRERLLPSIAAFLGCSSSVPAGTHLSSAPYACLGSVSTFSEDRVLARFELAMQNDGSQGAPWYLESLKTIAQERKSERLETRVIELFSLGTPTLSGLEEEFAKLGLTLESQEQLSDEQLADRVLTLPPTPNLASLLAAISSARPTQTWQRAAAAPNMSADDALRVFSTDTADEATIIERFTSLWSHGDPASKLEARYALQTLAVTTRNPRMLALYESVAPAPADATPTYEEALNGLGLTPDVSDQDIMAIFEANIDEISGNKLLELRRALRVIAEERRSVELLEYLGHTPEASHLAEQERQRDLIDLSSGVQQPRLPVGLWNIGNTCYLNSLLQFYYSLPPVREYVINYQRPHTESDSSSPSETSLGDENKRLLDRDYQSQHDHLEGHQDPDAVITETRIDSFSSDEDSLVPTPSHESMLLPLAKPGDGATTNIAASDSATNTTTTSISARTEASSPESSSSTEPGVAKKTEAAASTSTASSSTSSSSDQSQSSSQSSSPSPSSSTSSSTSSSASNGASASSSEELISEEECKKIGGRLVPPKEIKRSQIFVDRLGKLFRQIHDTPSAHITPSEILAYMALVPAQEDADDVIAASGPKEESSLRGRLVGALQRQQDVTECIENVLDQLEATMSPESADPEDGEQYDLIKKLFYGTTIQTLARVEDGKNRRTKTERFSSLLLDVSDGPTNIYDSLDNYFADDILELEDGPTLRSLRIKSLPEILQIQVQRVQFDKTTYLPYKNLNPLIFPEVVYMDRYLDMEPGSDLDLRSQKVKSMRKELREIEERLEGEGQTNTKRRALAAAIEWLSKDRVSEATLSAVKAHYSELCSTIFELETRRDELKGVIAHEFDDLTEYGYTCHALFIHKGDVSYGHYWIYIRDPKTGEFYKYNDEIVSKVSREEVFDFSFGNPATPYFLVFVRERELE